MLEPKSRISSSRAVTALGISSTSEKNKMSFAAISSFAARRACLREYASLSHGSSPAG